jgi:hypothetical protein
VAIAELRMDNSVSICTSEISGTESIIADGLNTLIGTLLSNGLRVDHYMRLDKRKHKEAELAFQLLGFLKLSDNYRPYAVTSRNDIGLVFDLVLIPGSIAVLLMATKKPGFPDTAWVYTNPEKIKSLASSVNLMKGQTMPLASIFTPPSEYEVLGQLRNDWEQALNKGEARNGDRFVMLDSFSTLTEPLSNVQSRLVREAKDAQADPTDTSEWVDKIVSIRRDRITQFQSLVGKFEHRDICPLSFLYEYKSTGMTSKNDSIKEPATKEEFRTHLKHIIDMLQTYPNYELALVDDVFKNEHVHTWWEVKGTDKIGTVFLEIHRVGGKDPGLAYIALHNSAITQAFRTYFNDLWDSIELPYREKNWVIKQLELASE